MIVSSISGWWGGAIQTGSFGGSGRVVVLACGLEFGSMLLPSFAAAQGKKGSLEQAVPTDEEVPGIQNVRTYSYKELRHATEDFNPLNKIGEGGFGAVYKGRLKDGTVVAIKVLSSESKQGVQEFLAELKTLANIVHENLVELYGFCVERNNRILVYNYLVNNSLAQTLLGEGHSSLQFNWRIRTKICIGVARGLAFLHEEVRPRIVHRDVKASNILLDKDLNPKISDFGLAKLFPDNATHISTQVAGTRGYLAPEYAIRGQLTRKADIYSFGVLLLEIVSGRCNTNTRLPVEDQFLVERTWALHQRNELVLIIDSNLDGDFDAEEACRFLKVGLLCAQGDPKLRPSMSTVIQMLTGARDADLETITKPGLISDFMDLKVRSPRRPNMPHQLTRPLACLHTKFLHRIHMHVSSSLQYVIGKTAAVSKSSKRK